VFLQIFRNEKAHVEKVQKIEEGKFSNLILLILAVIFACAVWWTSFSNTKKTMKSRFLKFKGETWYNDRAKRKDLVHKTPRA
jgi:hypothetical protein